jgi:Probable zinc-ribbon domain
MTTIDGLRSAEHIARAKALRRASVTIATHAEPGHTRAAVLEKLALLIADLEGMPAHECRSCGIQFGVGRDELMFYRSRGLPTPTRCRACRNRRRQERAGRTPGPATGK